MSLSKIVEINCPICGEKQDFRVWQSVNVTEDIHMKDLIFNQGIFGFKCKSCGKENLIEYPFIYHNYDEKFFVYFDSSGEFKNIIETEGYRTRTASEYLEFLETIRLLEDNVDEERINNAKEELFSKFRANDELKNITKLYYTGMENNKIVFFVPEINGKITV